MRSARGLVVGVAMLAACAPRSPVHPAVDRQPWIAVESAHFTITTDVREEDARILARELEISWYALTGFYNAMVPGRRAPRQRTRVYYLRSKQDYRTLPLAPSWSSGYGASAADFSGARLIVTHHEAPDPYQTVRHELAHMFNRHYLSAGPTWLDEGLATYLETLSVRDGTITLGVPPPAQRGHLGQATPLALRELLALDDSENFYRGERSNHYLAAWRLVHMLVNGNRDDHERFRRYLAAIATGADRDRAWIDGFAERAPGLASDLQHYPPRRELALWTATLPVPAPTPPRIRRLAAGEAHEVWLLLLLSNDGHGDVADAVRRQLAAAETSAPDWPKRTLWTAIVAASSPALARSLGNPIAMLRDYLAAHPGDSTGWSVLITLQLDDVLADDPAGMKTRRPAALTAMEPDVLELVERSSTIGELDLVARYYAIAGRPRTAEPFARRALEIEPGCGRCVDTLALIELSLGHPDRAFDLQRRAVNMMGEDMPDSALARLRVYQQAAATAPAR